MEVQAHFQALIRDANRSCYLHHCKRSSVSFCNKNNLLSGFFKIRLMPVVKDTASRFAGQILKPTVRENQELFEYPCISKVRFL